MKILHSRLIFSLDEGWVDIPNVDLYPVKAVLIKEITMPKPEKAEVVVQKKDVYRVPLFKKGNIFVVWTGDGAVRYFNEDTLPDIIKVPLGIIMNSPKAAELNTKEMSDIDMAKGVLQDELFKAGNMDKSFEDIGWQYNKYYYVVVLSAEELASIKGAKGDAKPE